QARLILLGDRDQLASVEAGAVLSALCWAAPAFSSSCRADIERLTDERLPPYASHPSALGDTVILLQQSYRFGPASSIGQLAHAVQRGDATAAMQLLQAAHFDDLVWIAVRLPAEFHARFAASIRGGFQPD